MKMDRGFQNKECVIELHILPAPLMVQKTELLKPINHFSKQGKDNLLRIH